MLQFAIPCLLGLESLVGDEVKKLGLADVKVENGRVLCRGEERDLARLNINLRCGARVLLVLASFFAGVYFDMGYINVADMIAGTADEEGVMMAFITLNMVEIFHCFNMRSRRASLFTMKRQNKWLWGASALALVLTVIVTQVPALALMFFGDVTLELRGVLWALLLAFLIIPINEAYKAIMRAVEKDQ